MKRVELLKRFKKSGWRILREGANHTILTDGKSVEPLPRHKEINEELAKTLIRKHNLKWGGYMKAAYLVIIDKNTMLASVPDFDIQTQGTDIENCIEMAREAIGLTGISLEDIGKTIPKPSYELPKTDDDKLCTFVDVDFGYYRQIEDNRLVRRNCTIPNYLNAMGERAGLNFSEVLRTALMERLNIE